MTEKASDNKGFPREDRVRCKRSVAPSFVTPPESPRKAVAEGRTSGRVKTVMSGRFSCNLGGTVEIFLHPNIFGVKFFFYPAKKGSFVW